MGRRIYRKYIWEMKIMTEIEGKKLNGNKWEKIRWVLVASGWMNHHIENVAFSRPSGVLGTPH